MAPRTARKPLRERTVPKKATGFKSRQFTSFQARRPVVMPVFGELKFHDVNVDQAVADLSAGVILNTSSINLIAQGVTESTRIGRKVSIKSINWRGQLNKPISTGSGGATTVTVRLMVVLDRQANGAPPTVLGVLETEDFQSFNNLANKGRFTTLYDKVTALQPTSAMGNGTANDSGGVVENFTFFKKCDIDIEFDSTAGIIGEIRSNNLFILMITDTAATQASLDSKIRLRFEG